MSRPNNDMSRIREVWAENLEEEMGYIRNAIQDYPFVAMVSRALSPLAMSTRSDRGGPHGRARVSLPVCSG